MTDIITRSKPAKHGKRLDGRQIIIRKGKEPWISGIYEYASSRAFWLNANGKSTLHDPERWEIEEIVETEE